MRTRRTCGFVLFFVLFFGGVYSVAAHRELLGATPEEIIGRLGVPESVYSSNSPIADVHAVVFFYDDYRYVYFYDNRVWQVRLDERSEHGVQGLGPGIESGRHAVGDSADPADPGERRSVVVPGNDRSALFDTFGSPVFDDGESLVFELEDLGYPVRLRAFVDDRDTVVDIYLYRADF